jgi:hypothetical protein
VLSASYTTVSLRWPRSRGRHVGFDRYSFVAGFRLVMFLASGLAALSAVTAKLLIESKPKKWPFFKSMKSVAYPIGSDSDFVTNTQTVSS